MPSPLALRFWGGHLVMVVLLAAAVLLGLWQISVYEGHRADAAIDRTHDRVVPIADALGPDQAFPGDALGRPVTVAGSWLPQDTVLVSGQDQAGREGYWMVTPVAVSASGSALPVVLGWLADPSSAPAAPTGDVRLTAWLQPSEGDDGQLAETAGGSGLTVLPDLRTAELVQTVDQDLYDGYAVAQGGVAGLAQAELPDGPDAGPWTAVRNLLYGIQWWVFGGFAVLMWWRWLAEARAAALEDEAGDEPAGDTGDHRLPVDEDPVSTVKA